MKGTAIEDVSDFKRACRSLGGSFEEVNDHVYSCELGRNEIVYHDYLGDGKDIMVYENDSEGPSWRAESRGGMNFARGDSEIIVENAEGHPGPQDGPMYVDDATVRISEYSVNAERVQQL